MIRNANFSFDKMNIIIKNSIDNITKCDIIFIEIKNVETKDGCHDTISYQNTEII
nr:MAG TPA: hypothetical protein [Caudoviricetes sp.]